MHFRTHRVAWIVGGALIAPVVAGTVAFATVTQRTPWDMLRAQLPAYKQGPLDRQEAAHAAEGSPPPQVPNRTAPPGLPNVSPIWLYGIQDLRQSPWPQYTISNTWFGTDTIVYGGSLSSDPSQGVVIIAQRNTSIPVLTAVIQSQESEGPLKIASVSGSTFQLLTPAGVKYTFDLELRTLVRIG